MKNFKALLFISFAFSFCVSELSASIAQISEMNGKVLLQESGSIGWEPVAKKQELNSGDRLKTEAASRAVISFYAGHTATVGASSEMLISQADRQKTALDLFKGQLRSKVKKLSKNQAYSITTPQAVCAVRGTDFNVAAGANSTSVKVFSGLVEAMEITTGQKVDVAAGQMSTVVQNAKPTAPVDFDLQKSRIISDISEEARREMFEEISREEVMSRASEEVKKAEYENGKALIDVHGNRVRLEEYIVRPEANQFKYVVLNNRENRFDFSKILFQFNKELPADLTEATSEMFSSDSASKPEWILTDMVSLMSNTMDQINEEAGSGDMVQDSNDVWKHYFGSYEYSIKGYGKSYSNPKGKILFNQTVTDSNSTYEGLAVTTVYLGNTTATPAKESSSPDGADIFHFYEKTTYSDGTWLAVHDYLIDDEGNIKTSTDLSDNFAASSVGGKSFQDYLSELNYESTYTSSEFDDRDIDIVFSTKILLDSGLIAVAYDE